MTFKEALASAVMPERVARLPRDPRGYPIFFAITQEDGTYDFEGMALTAWITCATERLCGICGEELGYWIHFVGGPKSCAGRVFTDPPMHRECVEYAFQVCPFLLRSWDRTKRAARLEYVQKVDPTGDVSKPEKMGIYVTRSYEFTRTRRGAWLFKAAPAKAIEWRDNDGVGGTADHCTGLGRSDDATGVTVDGLGGGCPATGATRSGRSAGRGTSRRVRRQQNLTRQGR